MNLRSQLKFYLELRSMTAAELARKSGVSKQVIHLWLCGSEPGKVSQIKKVSDALGTTVDELCFGKHAHIEKKVLTNLNAILGDDWVTGVFEVRFRKIKHP